MSGDEWFVLAQAGGWSHSFRRSRDGPIDNNNQAAFIPDNGYLSPPARHGVSVLIVQQCLKLGKAHGLWTEQMLAVAGLRREEIDSPNRWLPFSSIEQLVRGALIRGLLKDPLLGLRAALHPISIWLRSACSATWCNPAGRDHPAL